MENFEVTTFEPSQSEVSPFESMEILTDIIESSAKLKEKKPVLNLTAQYHEFEKPGETFRCVFMGVTKINVTDQQTGEQRSIPAVRFMADKQVFINAGVVLVREFEQARITPGTPVEIAYTGKSGNVKLYSISLLS
jgi:hypothetical protein